MSTTRRRIYDVVMQLKSQPCMDCGKTYPPVVMDFDHRPGEEKLFNVAKAMADRRGMKKVLDEIAKCDLVCSNCHRIRTWLRSQ